MVFKDIAEVDKTISTDAAATLVNKLNATNTSASLLAAASLASQINATNTSVSLLAAASLVSTLNATSTSASLLAAASLVSTLNSTNTSASLLSAASLTGKLDATNTSASHLAASVDAAACALATGLFGSPLKAVGYGFGWLLAVSMLFTCCRHWRHCRLRDIGCARWCMRCIGWDSFDEFECIFIVHNATLECAKGGKVDFRVRVSAGQHSVCTSHHKTSEIQEPLSLFIEQGVSTVSVDFVKGSLVIATLRLDAKDIHAGVLAARAATFSMRLKTSGFINNSHVKLSIIVSSGGSSRDADAGHDLARTGVAAYPIGPGGQPISPILRSHLESAGVDFGSAPKEQMTATIVACCGPLVCIGGWGTKRPMYFGVKRTSSGHYIFGLWKRQADFQHGTVPQDEANVLRVKGVTPLGGTDAFSLHYAGQNGRRHRWNFNRTDRNREIWIEHIGLVARHLHGREREQHEARAAADIAGVPNAGGGAMVVATSSDAVSQGSFTAALSHRRSLSAPDARTIASTTGVVAYPIGLGGQAISPRLRSHLESAGVDFGNAPKEQMAATMVACCGPLVHWGSWGTKHPMYFGVQKTSSGHYIFGLWKTQSDFQHGIVPQDEANVLRVQGVTPLGGTDAFSLYYAGQHGRRHRWNFCRTDRDRDIWIAHIGLVAGHLHGRAREQQRRAAANMVGVANAG